MTTTWVIHLSLLLPQISVEKSSVTPGALVAGRSPGPTDGVTSTARARKGTTLGFLVPAGDAAAQG